MIQAHMADICSVNYTADPDEWYVLLEIPDMWRIIAPVDPKVEPDEAMQDRYLQNCLQNLQPRPEPYEIAVKAIYRSASAWRKPIATAGCSWPATRRTSIIPWAGSASMAGSTMR